MPPLVHCEWRDAASSTRCTFWWWWQGAAARQCARRFGHDGDHEMRADELEDFGSSGNFRRKPPLD